MSKKKADAHGNRCKIKTGPKCGEGFMKMYNGKWCPDCVATTPMLQSKLLSSLGCEDLVTHFSQNIGYRLQRVAGGHFEG